MKILDKGHQYLLKDNKTINHTCGLRFFKDAEINDNGYPGTTNQEVLRVLIDRIKFLDEQLPHKVNQEIITHLRKALILHEQRHLDRLLDKNFPVEDIKTTISGHFFD